MESIKADRGPLVVIADHVLNRHIAKCKECDLGDKWKPCDFHRGFVAGMIGLINQINVELESAGFYG
jgi:hypothetical protein